MSTTIADLSKIIDNYALSHAEETLAVAKIENAIEKLMDENIEATVDNTFIKFKSHLQKPLGVEKWRRSQPAQLLASWKTTSTWRSWDQNYSTTTTSCPPWTLRWRSMFNPKRIKSWTKSDQLLHRERTRWTRSTRAEISPQLRLSAGTRSYRNIYPPYKHV